MAISFNFLGQHGRLGNQMFQYAALKAIAMRHNYDFTIPPSDFINSWKDHQLFDAFKLESLTKENIRYLETNKIIKEEHFHFNQKLYEECPDNSDLFGYFQTEKYFNDISSDVKKDFTFKDEIYSEAKKYKKIISDDKIISLHIRRGDYVNQPWHGCCPISYYEKCLSILPSELPVIIFTDDPKWALDQPLFESDRFYVSEKNNNLFDMCLMTLCNYHIIANSSFSWWGAWLSESEKVIAPEKWFGPPLSDQNDIKDLIPNNWQKI